MPSRNLWKAAGPSIISGFLGIASGILRDRAPELTDPKDDSASPPEDENYFASEKWAAIYDSLVRDYGADVVRQLYGPTGKIRAFCERHQEQARAYALALPPFFRVLLRPLPWWVSDFLRIAGPIAWDYQPFWQGVRLLHVQAELPRDNRSPVLLPGLAGKSRIEIAEDARTWDEFKKLPDVLQGYLLGWSWIPLYGGAGNDTDATYNVSVQAREELKRFLKVERDLLRRKRPHASLRHLRTLRQFEWLREAGASWSEAEKQLSEQQERTPTAIRGDVQRAMRALGLNRPDMEHSRPHHKEPTSADAAAQTEPCPIHGKPMDAADMACVDCRNEAKTEFPTD
jgi:hypothetical protein